MSQISLDAILQLPAPQKLELLEKIWESLVDTPEVVPFTDAQRAELDRRIAAHERDPDDVVSLDELKQATSNLRDQLRGQG